MVSFEGFAGSPTSVADIYNLYIYIYIYIYYTKPQIEHDYLSYANVFMHSAIKAMVIYINHYTDMVRSKNIHSPLTPGHADVRTR